VARLHETLIDVMKAGESASFEARYERLEPVVLESFHLPLIARLVLAGHWQRLSESEQETFVQLMGRLTTATYAARFDGYDGHRFETYADQAQRRGLHVVRARFGKPKGETRQFDYQLRETRDGWRIINVAVDGVSDLSLKRAQYQEVVDKHGFKELLKRLRDKVADLADPGTEEQDDG